MSTWRPLNGEKSTTDSSNSSMPSSSSSRSSSSATDANDLPRTSNHTIFRSNTNRFKICNPQESHSASIMSTSKTFLRRIPSIHRVSGKSLVTCTSTITSRSSSIEERSPSQSTSIRIDTSLINDANHKSLHMSSQNSRQDGSRALEHDLRESSSPTQVLYTHERLHPFRRGGITSARDAKPHNGSLSRGAGNDYCGAEEDRMYYFIPFYHRTWELSMGCQ